MSGSHFAGPIITLGDPNNVTLNPAQVSGSHFLNGEPGGQGAVGILPMLTVTAITDSTAFRLGQISVPNTNASFVALVLLRAAITNSSHTYDSTRVNLYTLVVTRVTGANAVATLQAVTGAAGIATSSGGQTFTLTLALAAVSGGVTATNTININLTDVNGGSAGTTEGQLTIIDMGNSLATTGIVITA